MKKMRTLLFCGAMTAALSAATVSTTHAAILNFDGLSTGSFVGSQYFASNGVTIAATNNNPSHPDVATIFDSNKTNTPDEDLEDGWAGGNLVGTNLGKLLIVAENVKDSDNNGKIDKPDDEHDGGNILFNFAKPASSLGFDVIDVEFATPIDYVEFFTDGVSTGTLSFDKFTNSASPFYDPTVAYGDHTANHIAPINISALRIPAFNAVIFHLGECMAIDNVSFTSFTAPSLPEPSLGLVSLGVPMLLAMRRRQR